MTHLFTSFRLLLLLLTVAPILRAAPPSFAGEWAIESAKEPPCLYLQPDGRAGLAAICIGAMGRWHYDAGTQRVFMDLKDADGKLTHYVLKPNGPKKLVVEKPSDLKIWKFYKTSDRMIH